MTCRDCRWWNARPLFIDAVFNGARGPVAVRDNFIGECRRYAPCESSDSDEAPWTKTLAGHACGDFEVRA